MKWSPSDGHLAPMPVPGLLDLAVLPDGRSAMLVETSGLCVRATGVENYIKWNVPPRLATCSAHQSIESLVDSFVRAPSSALATAARSDAGVYGLVSILLAISASQNRSSA